MEKKITNFTHHMDNAKEIISASDINKLQDVINEVEKSQINLYDEQFRQRAFFALENSLFANSMFMDELDDPYKILMAQSSDIFFDKEESCVKVAEAGNISQGTMTTVKLEPQNVTVVNEFSLVVDHHIPKGSAIKYFISNDGVSFYPIRPNASDATVIQNKGSSIFLKAVLYKNRNYESPKIYGWSILYRDPVIDNKYALKNVDLSRLDATTFGETILYRNKDNNDRLEIIIDPSSTTELFYDSVDSNGEPRLSHILTRVDDRIIQDTMNYGLYENSKGEMEDVLLSISTALVHDSETGGKP